LSGLLERLGIELPVVQAGMGGGLSRGALAGAVSGAGGLGTVGFEAPERMRAEVAEARSLAGGRPVAANLLLPFVRGEHWEAASTADVVVTFWGRPRRRTDRPWVHQVGSVDEARAAAAAGADAVIAQGVQAGGHVRGAVPALQLLSQVRASLPEGFPVLLAGGIADADDVAQALEAGAVAVVLGTRFVMSDEANAARAYKQRLMESRETVLTELFGMGWPAPHRVLWNEAAERWLDRDGRGPRWLGALQRSSAPLVARLPIAAQARMAGTQTAGRPLFGPFAPTADGPSNLLDAGALYAGESVARIHDIRPAAELARELARAA
jgi:NAD(P)H-dependent flavin oxidoreductase YrpB (nitropropane dioxygenase family)